MSNNSQERGKECPNIHETVQTNRNEAGEVLERRNVVPDLRLLEVEINHLKQRNTIAHTSQVSESLTKYFPFGKDCTRDLCHPYTVAIKEVLWGFATNEIIKTHEETPIKYKSASSKASEDLRSDLYDFAGHVPVVPDLSTGLPLPFTFRATNQVLSRDDRPYWFWPYTQDPNPGRKKHGLVIYECKDLTGRVIATRNTFFDEYDTVTLSCNEVASKFGTVYERFGK